MAERRLTVTRGLPGSGKTTWANAQIDALLVNRDKLRDMLSPGPWPWHDPIKREPLEAKVTDVQRAILRELLAQDLHVIVHDTNLDPDHVGQLAFLAEECGAVWRIVDFTDVPLDTCIERDAARPEAERVGETIIRRMHDKYLGGAR